ncbi:VWA domain-containing protein [Pseudomonas nicosulfuronedens]|uniref:vWA domain-containing protein n=1 Tax=Pseudomonas nicosulfuronedens TaxID=2571105 RepID=UPI001FE51D21|nr:VWA domain-containing protein [Pseudomonas nicosulfuronedens]MDH1008164.1 VWA domain-containing protein [Pseudomonas nicosulfuronedens]MDH1981944.1 VWA domain-containing protein [Pseudomonas nicosulfuronedens]MDH2030194.1 VWA domain-containing protein [Pseudomonas nicosulfuronedens]
MAKKALSIRPRPAPGADANPRPGQLAGGRSGARQPGAHGRIDWPATLRNGRPQHRADLVLRARSRKPGELWLVIVDASASTRRHGALAQAKGLLADTFEQAYRQRARLALLHATGTQARWLWQGQKASSQLQEWLEQLGAGGGTPLIEALQQAREWLDKRQRQQSGERQRLLVLTDGRLRDWPELQPLNCPTLLVDIEGGAVRLGRARKLAQELDAEYRPISDLASKAR